MSNFIPMLSSSPPPLDDSGGIEDWEKGDENDFGGFASAAPAEERDSSENLENFSVHSTAVPIGKDKSKSQNTHSLYGGGRSGPDATHSSQNGNQEGGSFAHFDNSTSTDPERTGAISGPSNIQGFTGSPLLNDNGSTFQSSTSVGLDDQNTDFKILPSDDEEEFSDFQTVGESMGDNRTKNHSSSGKGSSLDCGSHQSKVARGGEMEASTVYTDLTSSSMSGTASIDSASHGSGDEVEDLKHANPQCSKQDTQDNTSQDSVTDSGLCSDISPITKFEDYPDFGETRNMDHDAGFSDGPPDMEALKQSKRMHKVTPAEIQGQDECSPDQEDDLDDWGSVGDSGDTTPEVKDGDIGGMILGNKAGMEEDPEPLCLKPPEFTGEEETGLESLDDSFGQFDSELTKTEDSDSSEPNFPTSPTLSSGQESSSLDYSDNDKIKGNGLADAIDSDSDFPSTANPAEQLSSATEEDLGNLHQSPAKDEEDFGDFSEESTLKTDLSKAAKGIDEEDDDFGDFKDDNDDDFGDFTEVNTAGESSQPAEDKFGSFGDGEGFAAFGDSNTETEGDGNWAAFSEPAPVTASQGEDDEDFQDFEDAPSQPQPSVLGLGAILAQVSGPRVNQLVLHSYPLSDANGNQIDLELLEQYMSRKVEREQEAPAKPHVRHREAKSVVTVDISVWNNLKDLEKTPALKYQWSKSSSSSRLLRAIAVDTRNILMGHKKQSLPVYASHLGLLEPSREAKPKHQLKSEPLQPAAIVDTSSKPTCPTILPATTPQDIPPAEFDWGSSGLTNPLDSSNIQLDLDFFIKNTINTPTMTSPTAALENELLKSIEPPSQQQPRTLEPLENILANMKFTPTAPPGVNKKKQQEENLSQEANNLMRKLPSLTFMRAKVLMFPFKDTSD